MTVSKWLDTVKLIVMASYQCFLLTEPEHDDRKRMGMKVNECEKAKLN